jgi:hypothetical protein
VKLRSETGSLVDDLSYLRKPVVGTRMWRVALASHGIGGVVEQELLQNGQETVAFHGYGKAKVKEVPA